MYLTIVIITCILLCVWKGENIERWVTTSPYEYVAPTNTKTCPLFTFAKALTTKSLQKNDQTEWFWWVKNQLFQIMPLILNHVFVTKDYHLYHTQNNNKNSSSKSKFIYIFLKRSSKKILTFIRHLSTEIEHMIP